MPNVERIIGILIKEVLPAGIHYFNEQEKDKLILRQGEADEVYFKRLKKLVNASPEFAEEMQTHSHGGELDDCPNCGRQVEMWRQDDKPSAPHATKGGKDPHLDYTVHQLSKHLALLQDHYTSYRCVNCVKKHLMIIEGLAEEGLPMVKTLAEKRKFSEVKSWVKKASGRSDWDTLIDEARQVRLKLTGMEHEKPDEDEHHSHK